MNNSDLLGYKNLLLATRQELSTGKSVRERTERELEVSTQGNAPITLLIMESDDLAPTW